MSDFTDKQGQYFAFIYAYTKLHRRPPAEADMQRYFQVSPPSVHRIGLRDSGALSPREYFQASPPSVHRMVVELENRGLIRRQPGKPRSIELLISPEDLLILREPPTDGGLN
ncbi:MAG: hypothetical protein Tsb0020_08880 [Haliangiales bacterium]